MKVSRNHSASGEQLPSKQAWFYCRRKPPMLSNREKLSLKRAKISALTRRFYCSLDLLKRGFEAVPHQIGGEISEDENAKNVWIWPFSTEGISLLHSRFPRKPITPMRSSLYMRHKSIGRGRGAITPHRRQRRRVGSVYIAQWASGLFRLRSCMNKRNGMYTNKGCVYLTLELYVYNRGFISLTSHAYASYVVQLHYCWRI